ncbi:aldehyde dehydrogenase family protein [Streptomyces graminofaciens]|uniref:aldehyde dehydrogenase family protein n=1 Tax=Streptomyces graminofaciens TaxID=68212 RepID=UPI0025747CCC|nr:aldehyde dehydrogenase family protein [Streptomyces graminofaciens]
MTAVAGHLAPPAPTKVKNHPFMVWGRRVEPDGDARVLEFPNGARSAVPLLTPALADQLRHPPTELAETPLQEIVAYLNRIGHLWNNEEYARRRLYIRELKRMHGYSQQMADAEADLISTTLRAHGHLHDMVAVELGHRQIMDRWIPREDAEVRAYPRGRSVHILPGNVPYSTTVSLVRALLTKNTSVLKYAAGEPVTAVVLAQSFTDIDPDHPVTRSVSAVFWERDSELGRQVLADADVICAWGGAEAVNTAYRNCSSEAIVVPYGPRRSFTVVGKDADMARAARGIAHDASMYEQRACFSTHQVFTDADPEEFADRLQAELVRYEDMLPRTSVTADEAAQASMEVAAQRFLGRRTRTGSWGSILITDPATVTELPSARTVFIHPVKDLAEVAQWVDPTVQTIGLAPWTLHERLRHELARRGACRFVEAGLSPLFRLGGSHDGLQPLQLMTRMVSVEAPRLDYGKGMVVPIDQSEFLEHRRLRDLLM